ncbi:MAG: hypothetical protein ACE5GW_05500 [Planctomycetota bacterium]
MGTGSFGATLTERFVPSATPCGGPIFARGDCNAEGSYNIGDAVFTLSFLFANGTNPSCEDACDANDDGALNISDPIYSLGRLFSTTPPPPAPFPGCGEDPTVDPLECAAFGACP